MSRPGRSRQNPGGSSARQPLIRTDSWQGLLPGSIYGDLIPNGGIQGQHMSPWTMTVGQYIRSSNYAAGSSGWNIDSNGNAEFNDVTVRGTVTSSTVVGSKISTSSSGNRVELDGTRVSGSESIRFYAGSESRTVAASIRALTDGMLRISAAGSSAAGTNYGKVDIQASRGFTVNGNGAITGNWSITGKLFVDDNMQFAAYRTGDGHAGWKMGPNILLKALAGSTVRLQCRTGNDAAYAEFIASNVSASDPALKRNIRPALRTLDMVRGTPTYEFEYKARPGVKQIGFMADEVPPQLATPEGDGIYISSAIGALWKAVQELADKVDALAAG